MRKGLKCRCDSMTLLKTLNKEEQKRIIDFVNKDIELIDKQIDLLKSIIKKLRRQKLFLKQVRTGQQSLENLLRWLKKRIGKRKQCNPVTWTEIDDWAEDLDSMCYYIEDTERVYDFPYRKRDGSEFKELIQRIAKEGLTDE